MRLDNVTVQGGQDTPPVLLPMCVCVAGPVESMRRAQPVPEFTCPECGGSRSQPVESVPPENAERQERRRLQDFLSGFV